MKIAVSFCFLFLLLACGNSNSSGGSSNTTVVDLGGFTVEALPGTAVQRATKKDNAGVLLEEGKVLDGKRFGTWVTFHTSNNRIKTITSYVEGLKSGRYMEMNDRGQVELEANYTNDVLDGPWIKYKYGSRKSKEVLYKMGVIDEYYREYHNNGKLMKDIQYTNGKMNGYFKQFDDKEKLLMQYEYRDGEKVSGGIAAPEE
ncbi:MAG: hypothetical protein AAF990_14635 [Bacteroidota bacterium]